MLRLPIPAAVATGAALTLAAAAIAATPAPAAAASPLTLTKRTVRHGDLDLTQTPGVQILKRRVDAAVQRVCAPVGRLSLAERPAHRACLDAARADAAKQVERAVADAEARRRLVRN